MEPDLIFAAVDCNETGSTKCASENQEMSLNEVVIKEEPVDAFHELEEAHPYVGSVFTLKDTKIKDDNSESDTYKKQDSAYNTSLNNSPDSEKSSCITTRNESEFEWDVGSGKISNSDSEQEENDVGSLLQIDIKVKDEPLDINEGPIGVGNTKCDVILPDAHSFVPLGSKTLKGSTRRKSAFPSKRASHLVCAAKEDLSIGQLSNDATSGSDESMCIVSEDVCKLVATETEYDCQSEKAEDDMCNTDNTNHVCSSGCLFKCKVCGKCFSFNEDCQKHEKSHLKLGYVHCKTCDQYFSSPSKLKKHDCNYKNLSAKETPMKSKKPLKRKPSVYICDVCGKVWKQKSDFVKHYSIHTGEKRYVCDICGRSFLRQQYLSRHRILHSGDKPFTCGVCGKAFAHKISLKTHYHVHTGDKSLKPYECSVCNKAFSQKLGLVIHNRTHTGEEPFECEFCSKTFKVKQSLATHVRTHTGLPHPYVCSVCGKRFASKQTLIIHVRCHTGERPYVCSVCGKAFAQSKHLKDHCRLHTGEKPYVCDVCGLAFTHKIGLKVHNRFHTGERPYVCEICNKGFTQKQHLKDHSRIHTGERPYVCGICNMSFVQKQGMKSHTRIHTGERPYVCELCQVSFTRRRLLRDHNCPFKMVVSNE